MEKDINLNNSSSSSSSFNNIPPCPTINYNLAIINDDAAYEQCGSWSFLIELIEDLFNQIDEYTINLENAIKENNHVLLEEQAHSLKGVALNLHLPALADICQKLQTIGRQLIYTPNCLEYLLARRPMFIHYEKELERLTKILPEYIERAENENEDDLN